MDPSTDLATMSVKSLAIWFHNMMICDPRPQPEPGNFRDKQAILAELERRCSSRAVGPEEVEVWEKRAVEAESAYHAKSAELARLLASRPGHDAVPAGIREAVDLAFADDVPPDGMKDIARALARFILSLPPARGYDAGFAAAAKECPLCKAAKYVKTTAGFIVSCPACTPGADRDAGK